MINQRMGGLVAHSTPKITPVGCCVIGYQGQLALLYSSFSSAIIATAGTVECWWKPTTYGFGEIWTVMQWEVSNNPSSSFLLMHDQSPQQDGLWACKNTTLIKRYASQSVSTGTWYHSASTFDAANNLITHYFNGAPIGTNVGLGVGVALNNPETSITLSRVSRNQAFSLCEARIWTVVRTPAEIAYAYSRRARGDETGLWACWPLAGHPLDISPNNRHLDVFTEPYTFTTDQPSELPT